MAKKAKVYPGTEWVDLAAATVDLSTLLPSGVVAPFAGTTTPDGYLPCDGSAVNRTTYSRLFSAIGTTYGVGNGSTTFNLPDLRGRVATGRDATQTEFDNLGETGGAKTHQLTANQQADMLVWYGAADFANAAGGGGLGGFTYGAVAVNNGSQRFTAKGSGAALGAAHNILQPYITLNYIIKV